MSKFLRYIGCIQEFDLPFQVSLEEFNDRLRSNLDPRYIQRKPIKASKPYNGLIAGDKFEVNQNLSFFGTNWNNADISGKVEKLEHGINVHMTSKGFKAREVLFVLAGIVMMAIGIFRTITEPSTENYVMIAGGTMFIVFPFLSARRDAIKTLDDFQFSLNRYIKEPSRQQMI